jgi:hypothetical protein
LYLTKIIAFLYRPCEKGQRQKGNRDFLGTKGRSRVPLTAKRGLSVGATRQPSQNLSSLAIATGFMWKPCCIFAVLMPDGRLMR